MKIIYKHIKIFFLLLGGKHEITRQTTGLEAKVCHDYP